MSALTPERRAELRLIAVSVRGRAGDEMFATMTSALPWPDLLWLLGESDEADTLRARCAALEAERDALHDALLDISATLGCANDSEAALLAIHELQSRLAAAVEVLRPFRALAEDVCEVADTMGMNDDVEIPIWPKTGQPSDSVMADAARLTVGMFRAIRAAEGREPEPRA